MFKTTGTNVIIEPIAPESGAGAVVRKGKVLAVGEKVVTVSKENIVTYDVNTAPASAHDTLPYLIIGEKDIFDIKEA